MVHFFKLHYCVLCFKFHKTLTFIANTHSLNNVDDWNLAVSGISILKSGLLRHQSPQLVEVQHWAEDLISPQMVVPHSQLKIKKE